MRKFTDNEWNHMHDCIIDLTMNTTMKNCNREELMEIYENLPLSLKSEAIKYGMNDTLWRDKFCDWYVSNYTHKKECQDHTHSCYPFNYVNGKPACDGCEYYR